MCIDYIIACAGCHAPELIAATKFKTTKINFRGLFGLSTKINTHKNYLLYGMWAFVYMYNIHVDVAYTHALVHSNIIIQPSVVFSMVDG